MTINVKVKTDKTKDLIDDIEKWFVTETNQLIEDIYATTKENTPVLTGAAKAAWEKVEIDNIGDLGEVGNPKKYLKYVEDGTAHITPRKFITRSLIKALNKRK